MMTITKNYLTSEELYERLIPALNTKVTELKRNDLDYIKQDDIWNYLKDSKWKNANNLLLYQMVDDILNLHYTSPVRNLTYYIIA